MTGPPEKHWLRALAANLAVLAVGMVAALVLLEVGLRIYNPFQTRIRGDRIVLTANTRTRYTNYQPAERGVDPEFWITRNALGFRGPDPPARFAERLTLVAIGGSTTRCGIQSDDKTWIAHLGRRLEGAFPDVWVNNAGLDGHTTYGHLVMLEDHVAKLRPSVVLFLVGVNDVMVGPDNDRHAENIRSPLRVRSIRSFIKRLSAYSEIMATGLDLYRSTVAHRVGLGYGLVRVANLPDRELSAQEVRADRLAVAGPERLAAFGDRLERLIATTRAAGIEPVFMTQPALAGRVVDDVTGRDLSRVMAGPNRNGGSLWDLLEDYNEVTRRTCRAQGVFLIDLAREVPKSSRYFFDFVHFTNDGTVLVADVIHRSLCPFLARRFPGHAAGACPEATP